MFRTPSMAGVLVIIVIGSMLLLAQCACQAQGKEPMHAVAKIDASDCTRNNATTKTRGTGWIVHGQGQQLYLLTVSHVVENCQAISIEFAGTRGRAFPAVLVKNEGGDKGLALLSVANVPDSGNLAKLLLDEARLAKGDQVSTIGSSAGGGGWSTFQGYLSGFDGQDLIVQIPVDEGDSGGPVLRGGKVVGIVVLGKTTTGRAVSARAALDFVRGTLPLAELDGPRDGASDSASKKSATSADAVTQFHVKSVSSGNSGWKRPTSIRGKFAVKEGGVTHEYKFWIRFPDKAVTMLEDSVVKEYFGKNASDYWTDMVFEGLGGSPEPLTDEQRRGWLDWLSYDAIVSIYPFNSGNITSASGVDQVTEATDGPKKYHVLQLSERSGIRQTILLDAATGLVSQVRFRSPSEEWQYSFENYQRVDGTPFPFIWRAGKIAYFFSEVSFLENPDSSFARPREREE
jgi:hypothetical protein